MKRTSERGKGTFLNWVLQQLDNPILNLPHTTPLYTACSKSKSSILLIFMSPISLLHIRRKLHPKILLPEARQRSRVEYPIVLTPPSHQCNPLNRAACDPKTTYVYNGTLPAFPAPKITISSGPSSQRCENSKMTIDIVRKPVSSSALRFPQARRLGEKSLRLPRCASPP